MSERFSPLEPGVISGLVGMWSEIGAAFGRVFDTCNNAVNANTAWKGHRADLFAKWWDKADVALNELSVDANQVYFALQHFYERVAPAANDMDDAASLVRGFIHNPLETKDAISGTAPFDTDEPDARLWWDISLSRTEFKIVLWQQGQQIFNPPMPPKLSQAKSLYDGAKRKYNAAVSDAAEALGTIKPDLDRFTSTFPKVDPYDGWTYYGANPTEPGNPGTAFGYNDPTWLALTGSGVFKPDATGQFEEFTPTTFDGRPGYEGRDLPSWYDPAPRDHTGETIRKILEGVGTGLEIATVIAAFVQPELVPALTGLTVIAKSGEVITDVAADDDREALLDGADIVLTGVGLQNLAKTVAVKVGASEGGAERVKEVAGYVQGRIKEEATTNEKGETVISAADLQAIMDEAHGREVVHGLETTPAGKQPTG